MVTEKRIKLFESIQAQQLAHRQSSGGEPIRITLKDGAVKEGKKWLTSPMDVAKGISDGLASSCLIAQVNGALWDMNMPLEGDCTLVLFKFDSDEGRDTFWHSSAHILGEALEREYGCKLCVGPCTEGVEVEMINELPDDETITVYRCGPLVDLCRGPHIPNTSFVEEFACLRASSSYWKGKSDRESLQRVYGISFPDDKGMKIKDEVKSVLDFISFAYNKFGFTFELELSTRPEKYLGEIETWDKAEAALMEALKEFGEPWQLDFQLPLRFKLSYSAEKDNKLERPRPVMIHRAILGSFERMIGILLENYKGKWPFWLSPRQAMICLYQINIICTLYRYMIGYIKLGIMWMLIHREKQ